MSKASYAYATARVRVRRRELLDEEDYEKLVKMEVPQITRYLQDTGYEAEIDKLGSRYGGATLLEYGLSLNMANDFSSLLEMATGDLKRRLSAYLERYDVKNLKTILRGKSYGASGDEIRENLIPAGELSQEELYELEALPTRDMLERLSGGRYGEALEGLAGDFEESGRIGKSALSRAENELEKLHYDDLVSMLGPKPTPFSRAVRAEIDVQNVVTLLRLAGGGFDLSEEAGELIIDGGSEVDRELINQLIERGDPEGMMGLLREKGPWEIPEEVESPSDLENLLRNRLVEKAGSRANQEPLSIAPIIAYVLQKENEVDRVRIISRGKEAGMSPERIREMIG